MTTFPERGGASPDAGDPTSATGTRGPTVAWFHCFAGIAGDMALGSLLDAGADGNEVLALLRRLPFGGWALDTEAVLHGGIAATRAVVTVTDAQTERTYTDIVRLVEDARLPERVEARSLAVFANLAAVEARLHRQPVDRVHFHEVGGHDSIIDVVGTVAALEVLGVDEVEASPVAVGSGTVRTAHGQLPNPVPAVVALLTGAPIWGRPIPVELTTPTGAALLATLASAFGPMPAVHLTATGFGAGTREIDGLPNCTQVVVGTRTGGPTGSAGTDDLGPGQPVAHLEANVDDATGEQLAHAVGTLLEAGAHDAWLTPVIMKKGRPGTVVHVLCDPVSVSRLRGVLGSETGTLGVRGTTLERWPAARTFGAVEVDGHTVAIKVGGGRAKAEHDDAARAARALGLPLRQVSTRAEAIWREQHPDQT